MRAACTTLSVLLLLTIAVHGQTFRGSINGSVADPSGAVVPNASVKATAVATGTAYSMVTTTNGQFAFQDLPLGTYNITVAAAGFRTMSVANVNVTAGAAYTLPVKLTLGTQETVEVSADAVAIDTTTQTQNVTIEAATIDSTPLNGRDFTQFIAVAPGYGGYSVGGFGSLNGTRPNQMNWQIDGVDNNDFWHNIPAVNQGGVSGIAGVILPIDSIDEFSAQTQSGAEAGRSAGGTVNLVLKSGTNAFHGSAYYFNRNEFYSAHSPFLPAGSGAPKLRNQNYGGSVGGPIIKNKTFFFVTFERQQYIIGVSGLATEPSDAWINKSLAVLTTNGITESALSKTLIGPSGFWPRNLVGSLSGNLKNFFASVPSTGYSFNGVIKLDQQISEKHRLSVRWFAGQGSQTAPLGSSPALGTASSNLKDYFEVAPIHVQNYSVTLNSAVSNRLSNQVLFGVNYFNQVFHDFNNSFDTKALGLFLSPDATNGGKPILGAPNIIISGFEQIGLTPPEGRNDVTGHLTDNVSFVTGAHQLRFGGEVRQGRVNEFYHRRGTGTFVFDGTQGPWANSPNLDTNTKALADFLAGDVSASSIAVGDPERFVKVNAFNFFFQDAWQVAKKLNLNFGLRYEYFGPLHSDRKDLAVFTPDKGLQIQGKDISSIFPPDRNNFAPRFGFAYQLGEKADTVVRGGIGVFYDQINMNPFLDFRPPIAAAQGLEGNPVGPAPVSTFVHNGCPASNVSPSCLFNWQTDRVPGGSLFPGVISCTDPFCTNAPGLALFSVNQNFRAPYFYNFNLQGERTFGRSELQVGYVGSLGRKLNVVTNINQNGVNFPKLGNIIQLNSIGTSNYNALQTSYKVRSWHGLTSQLSYTWAHTLDQISEYRGVVADSPTNIGVDYGNGDYDTRHLFSLSFNYDIPGSSHGPKFLTHGWQISSLMNWHTGQPYDEVLSGLNLAADPFAGISHNFSAANGGTLWINPSAFCDPSATIAAGAPSCPNNPVSRNKFHGPGYGAVDLSVFKNIPITESVKVQLRAEMFNLLNRINLASGPSSVATGGCAQDPKTSRCAAFGSPAYGGFGLVSDTIGDFNGAPGIGPGEPFNMQIAIKVIF